MSIIQDALKKVQKYYADEKAEKPITLEIRPVETIGKKRALKEGKLTAILGAILVLLAGVALFQFKFGPLFNKNRSGASEAKEAKSYQETIYRPLAAKEAKEPAKPQPASARFSGTYPDLILNGIMFLDDGPRAIINNFIVTEGDSVGGAEITKIYRKSVVLKYNDTQITLNLK